MRIVAEGRGVDASGVDASGFDSLGFDSVDFDSVDMVFLRFSLGFTEYGDV